jgi:hypothetical protein
MPEFNFLIKEIAGELKYRIISKREIRRGKRFETVLLGK